MIYSFRTDMELPPKNSYSLTVNRVYRHIMDVDTWVGRIPIHNSFELLVFKDCNDASLVRALKEMIEYIEENSIEIKSGAF